MPAPRGGYHPPSPLPLSPRGSLKLEEKKAELEESRVKDLEIQSRSLTDKLRALGSLVEQKVQQGRQLEQDIRSGERMT